jgi:pimeloyl-ACP methyl ester carboxylesterase
MAELPDYPWTPRRFVRADGLSMAWLDEGPRSGEPVLMLHGNPSWSYYWRHLVSGLQDRWRCIVPDWIGMGRSDKPGDDRYRYTLASRVDDLEQLYQHAVREHGLPATGLTLAVHDWGGMIGLAWAVQHPERVARLLITNTGAFPNPKGQRLPGALRLGRDSALGTLLIRGFNAFAGGATRLATVRPMPPAVRAAYTAPYDSWANRIATLRFVQDIPLGPRDAAWPLVEATGRNLHTLADRPILLGWGLRDFVFDRAFFDEFVRRFPAAESHPWDDAGHYVLEDAHERLVPRVRAFLERHPLA